MNVSRKLADSTRRTRWGTPNTAGVSIPRELSFNAVSHKIGEFDVLRDVSLLAGSGSLTCLLGPSGSGKTTLLRIAAGMEQQTSGSVLLDGEEIGGPNVNLPPEKRGIGLVFQDYALFPHLTLLDNIMFGLAHLSNGEGKQQALKMLLRVGLKDRANDYPHHLSGGEQQRVALARALAPRPGVLLMDEPFSGLDSRLRETMREETLGILREIRATAIVVTHDPEEALRMGDQIALLHKGRLEQAGTGRDLYFRPKSLFAAEFFSELNYFDGKVRGGKVDTPLGPIPVNGAKEGQRATAAIRVNSIGVQSAENLQKGTAGRVLSADFSGEHDHLHIGINGSDHAVRARIKAGSLTSAALNGSADVVLSPTLEGSFVFPIAG